MDEDSPFARLTEPAKTTIGDKRTIHILFCEVCHYNWKAPAETKTCINCKGNGETVRSLVSYEIDIPLT